MSAPRKQQVSLRGASAKEITRDALLEKVSQERELRNYIRRSTAAALLIQSVWRRHCCMKNVAAQLHEEWESLANLQNVVMTGRWLSSNLLRPFIFFVTLHQKWKSTNVKCMLTCFRILLQSINSSEPKKNFCSLAIGTPEEKSIWLYQSRKLASICSLIVAEFDPMCHPNEDTAVLTSLAMQLLVALTDPKGWKISNDENIRDIEVAVKKLIKYMTVTSDLYSCIRRYILKFSGRRESSVPTEDHLLITASAVTLALRPFHFAKLLKNDLNHCDFGDATMQYCTFLLTVPSLAQCLPAVLVPALKHESVLSPCLNSLLISKGTVFVEMSKLDQSNVSDCGPVAIPCAAWALSNLINLATEYTNGSGDSSGQFVRGLDCRLYLRSIISITESVLSWLQNAGQIRKETVAHFRDSESSSESSISDICERGISLGSSLISYVDLFKPVHQQWHLTSLLAMVKKDGTTPAANEKFGSLRRLELLDIAYFYSYMLQIFLSLNHLGGSLPILNMLSFTPGFIVELWTTLESLIFSGMDHNFKDCRSSSPGVSGAYNNRVSEKRAGLGMKDGGNKWATALQKITGKSSYEVDFAHSFSCSSGLNHVDDDASDFWDVEPVRRGPEGISKDSSCLLHLFCATYGHLLLVLDDIEFYEKQVPFKLEQQRSIAAMLNTFVYNGISLNNGQQNKPLMDATIRCLHLLYERNCRHGFCPPSLWVAPARKGRLPIAAAARAHEVAVSINLRSGEALTSPTVGSILSITPHVFPFEERVQMFREFIKLDKVSRRMAGEVGGPGPGSVEVVVRRDHILEDGFRQLKSVGTRLKSTINVSFVSECGLPEAGLDYGGLSKEFLTDISRKAFDPGCGLFSQTSTSERSLIPNTASKFRENGIQMIEFVGQIVGKALYEGILLDYSFSVVFVQKLLGRYSFLDELSTLDPELYRNLIYVKHYDGDVRDISLDFTVTEELNGKLVVSELKPGGKSVTVTNENKLQYVHALADYKLNRQILPFANAFYRGLVDLISPAWLSLFNANEFNQLLSGGKHDFDVDDLKNNTRYTGGYSEGSRTIKLFWEAITGFEPNERCMLLKFVTSCSRAPLLGFKHLQPTFTIHKVACDVPLWAMIGGQDVDRLPSASTCYNTLKLPTYKRSSTLRSKLLYAISSNAGFELS